MPEKKVTVVSANSNIHELQLHSREVKYVVGTRMVMGEIIGVEVRGNSAREQVGLSLWTPSVIHRL